MENAMYNNMIHTPEGVRDIYGDELKRKLEIKNKIHKKIGTASATKEDQDGQVATSLSCGYKYNGEVIFPEKVDVYLFKK